MKRKQTVNSANESAKKLSLEQQEFVDDLKHSLEEVKLMQEGKIEKQSAEDFLNEL